MDEGYDIDASLAALQLAMTRLSDTFENLGKATVRALDVATSQLTQLDSIFDRGRVRDDGFDHAPQSGGVVAPL